MGFFNDPAWESLWDVGWVADTNYLYPARRGWINQKKNKDNTAYINIYNKINNIEYIIHCTI